MTSIFLSPARGVLGKDLDALVWRAPATRSRRTPKKLRHQFWKPAQRSVWRS